MMVGQNTATVAKKLFRHFSATHAKIIKQEKNLIINCKRSKLNFYEGDKYEKLSEIPLASKGWTHKKSIGDHFTIMPKIDDYDYPQYTFENFNLDKRLLKELNILGVSKATTFQHDAVSAVLTESHVMLSAETGCGKTIAYLLPIIEKLIDTIAQRVNQPSVLILVPNRELAHQIGSVASTLGGAVGLKTKVLVGGQTKRLMLNPEMEHIDILVSTPGVIGKLSTVGVYKLDNVKYAVFDEFDTLVDDSFLDRTNMILSRVATAQLILVSATLPRNIPEQFEAYQNNIVHVKSSRIHRPLTHVLQKFLRVSKSARPGHLLQIAKKESLPILVFSNKNETCNFVAMFLRENGVKCSNINGDMNYHLRIEQWRNFTSGAVNVLSATDIASRGLDTIQVNHVVNYDFPLYAADYIHRTGRIGRLGSLETAKITNLVSSMREMKLVQQIEQAIRTGTEVPNVNANITRLVKNQILKNMGEVQ